MQTPVSLNISVCRACAVKVLRGPFVTKIRPYIQLLPETITLPGSDVIDTRLPATKTMGEQIEIYNTISDR